jgi:hypothetical protein
MTQVAEKKKVELCPFHEWVLERIVLCTNVRAHGDIRDVRYLIQMLGVVKLDGNHREIAEAIDCWFKETWRFDRFLEEFEDTVEITKKIILDQIITTYSGDFTIEVWNGCILIELPVEKEQITGDRDGGWKIEVTDGTVEVDNSLRAIQFHSNGKPFGWHFHYIRKVTASDGTVIWQNEDDKEQA